LIQALLRNARHNYYVLKGHGLATSDMTSEFQRLQMLLRCRGNVAWRDDEQQLPRQNVDCSSNGDESHSHQLDITFGNVTFEQLIQFRTPFAGPSSREITCLLAG